MLGELTHSGHTSTREADGYYTHGGRSDDIHKAEFVPERPTTATGKIQRFKPRAAR